MKILIVDDHSIIRAGLRQILIEKYPSAVISEAKDAELVMKMVITNQFDIVICDLSMPGRGGLEVVEYMKEKFPKIPVLILSIHPEEQYAIRALKAGASGYLSKDAAPEELVGAVERILNGRRYISASLAEKMVLNLDLDSNKPFHEGLSNREFEVFKAIAEGKSVSEVAEQRSLSVTTVSTYRSRIMNKMNMKSNADFTRYCLEFKLI